MKINKAELARLIALVEKKLDELPPFPSTGYEAQRAYWQAAGEMLSSLADAGGKIRQTGDATRLALGGVTASSTGGAIGVLNNWLAAARRKLETSPVPAIEAKS